MHFVICQTIQNICMTLGVDLPRPYKHGQRVQGEGGWGHTGHGGGANNLLMRSWTSRRWAISPGFQNMRIIQFMFINALVSLILQWPQWLILMFDWDCDNQSRIFLAALPLARPQGHFFRYDGPWQNYAQIITHHFSSPININPYE